MDVGLATNRGRPGGRESLRLIISCEIVNVHPIRNSYLSNELHLLNRRLHRPGSDHGLESHLRTPDKRVLEIPVDAVGCPAIGVAAIAASPRAISLQINRDELMFNAYALQKENPGGLRKYRVRMREK